VVLVVDAVCRRAELRAVLRAGVGSVSARPLMRSSIGGIALQITVKLDWVMLVAALPRARGADHPGDEVARDRSAGRNRQRHRGRKRRRSSRFTVRSPCKGRPRRGISRARRR
jgi:hypothetical protein